MTFLNRGDGKPEEQGDRTKQVQDFAVRSDLNHCLYKKNSIFFRDAVITIYMTTIGNCYTLTFYLFVFIPEPTISDILNMICYISLKHHL